MTYRQYLITLLMCSLMALVLVGADSIRERLHNTLTAASLDSMPSAVAVAYDQAFVAGDGTLYFAGDGNKVLVRDPDGNLRSLPSTALARETMAELPK